MSCRNKKTNPWTTHMTQYKALCERMAAIGEKQGYVLNSDMERVEKVLGRMTENIVNLGKAYCPCKQSDPPQTKKDVICPCPDWKKEIERDGHCYCRLFYGKS